MSLQPELQSDNPSHKNKQLQQTKKDKIEKTLVSLKKNKQKPTLTSNIFFKTDFTETNVIKLYNLLWYSQSLNLNKIPTLLFENLNHISTVLYAHKPHAT